MLYLIVVFSLALLLIILIRSQFEIRTVVMIHAPAQRVWQAIIDMRSYAKWNTQLVYLGGDVAIGKKVQLRLEAVGAKPYEFQPTIVQLEQPKHFTWLAITGLPCIFDGEHHYELTAQDEKTTIVVNREVYRGVLSIIIRKLPMMKSAPVGFEQMNKELKAYVEGPQQPNS